MYEPFSILLLKYKNSQLHGKIINPCFFKCDFSLDILQIFNFYEEGYRLKTAFPPENFLECRELLEYFYISWILLSISPHKSDNFVKFLEVYTSAGTTEENETDFMRACPISRF